MKNEDIILRYRDLFGNQGTADQVLGSILEAFRFRQANSGDGGFGHFGNRPGNRRRHSGADQ